MVDEERESEEIILAPSPLRVALKWLAVLGSLAVLVGYGIWVGTIQNTIETLKEDVEENEKSIQANSTAIQNAETRERDRLNNLSDSVVNRFDADNEELWELKRAMAAVNTRVAMYHEGHVQTYQPSYEITAPPKKLSVGAKRKLAAKAADIAVLDALEEPAPPPMPTF